MISKRDPVQAGGDDRGLVNDARIIAALVRRLGGSVTLTKEELGGTFIVRRLSVKGGWEVSVVDELGSIPS